MFGIGPRSLSIYRSICEIVKIKKKSVRMSSHFSYIADEMPPIEGTTTTKMNMFQAINNALDLALEKDDSAVIFGEDVGFGGVFRCSLNLQVINLKKNFIENLKYSKKC